MFRKTALAIAATATLVAAALPSSASAKSWKYHGHRHLGLYGVIGTAVVGTAIASCYQYRWVETRRGMRRVLFNVCD